MKAINPLIPLDYPDPDVIRVEDRYYMVSTTMHFFPGCEILTSTDLLNWEHCCYVYDKLDSTRGQTLTDNEDIYGKGMWAASLRYHKGMFYVLFSANDTRQTYLYKTENPKKCWQKQLIEGFYHDASLLFDDDGRVFIIYGNTDIWLTELNEELTARKQDGIHKIIISEQNPVLGYEGAHAYKIDGVYYIFLISSLPDRWMRVQSCFWSREIDGNYIGKIILEDDAGAPGQGIAQGGIVSTAEGDWYMLLFQDRGAVGRMPVLVPFVWNNGEPFIGGNEKIKSNQVFFNEGRYNAGLVSSDNFNKKYETAYGLKPCWQFNHEPDMESFDLNTEEGYIEISHLKLAERLPQAQNTLTQRMLYPWSSAEVTLDCSQLKEGDTAGLCALQGAYGYVGVIKKNGSLFVTMRHVEKQLDSKNEAVSDEIEEETHRFADRVITLKMEADFNNGADTAVFFYKTETMDSFKQIGPEHQLFFGLDHFTGCRYGLFSFATEQTGGSSRFKNFIYLKDNLD